MIDLAKARCLLLAGLDPVGTETIPIAAAAGRVLAADLVAERDQPPQAIAAMDGYAVRREDAEAGLLLRVIGDAPAGAPFGAAVTAGTAVRIATGGVVPDGATQIVIQEHVARRDEWIRLGACEDAVPFIRQAGSDFRRGDRLAAGGSLITPALLGLIAAANQATVSVRRRPKVAILPSGDELREPGSRLAEGEVVNSAAYALSGLVERWGGTVVTCPILSDEPGRARRQLDQLEPALDLIVTLGGASVGERDRLKSLFVERGAIILFDKVAVQPGKPAWHARGPDRRLVLGLPGNPASAFVCAHLFLKPLLFALTRRASDPDRMVAARLGHALPGGGEREHFLRSKVNVDAQGRMNVTADDRQDSGLQVPLAGANALLRRMTGCAPAAAGDVVELLLIEAIEA